MHPTLVVYARAIRAQAEAEEAVIIALLGCWVSEIEPAVARRSSDGALLGLSPAGTLEGFTPFVLTPEMIGARP